MEAPCSSLKGHTFQKDVSNPCKPKIMLNLKLVQAVMVKTMHVHTFEPKYLIDYRVLEYLMKVHSLMAENIKQILMI